jgi:hypothetical protein
MARRKPPHDPAKAAQIALDRKAQEDERARLEAQGAKLTLDKGGGSSAPTAPTCSPCLLQRGTITPNQHDAAHTLCLAWAQWKGLDGRPELFGEVVDGGTGAAELITDRMIRGGREVEYTLAQIEAQERRLLEAFVVATVEEDRPMQWRGIVERVAGVTVRDRQTELVVGALESLRAVYQEPGRAAA